MDRKELYYFLCSDLSGDYVEVGTCWGWFAEFLLTFTPCSKLFCVDPYKHFESDKYIDSLNLMTQEEMDEKFLRVQEKLTSSFGTRVTMVRSLSTDAAKSFSDESLAFVYIDGNHMYHAVLEDLEAWYPKIAPGGILAGDDVEDLEAPHLDGNVFLQREGGPCGCYGVHTALVEFQKKHPEFIFHLEGKQFYWQKPKEKEVHAST